MECSPSTLPCPGFSNLPKQLFLRDAHDLLTLGAPDSICHTDKHHRVASTRNINTCRPMIKECQILNLEQKVNGTVMFQRTKALD